MDNTARTYVDHVEHDLLEAKHLLQLGLQTALERLGSEAESVKMAMTKECIGKLRAVEELSEESIDAIEKHLGELNYLAVEGRIKKCGDFDQLAQPLSEALNDARTTLAKLDEISMRELDGAAGGVAEAWRKLHLALDSARLQLALAGKDSEEEAERVRQDLTTRLEDALKVAKTRDAKAYSDKLHDLGLFLMSQFGERFKIFFGFSR